MRRFAINFSLALVFGLGLTLFTLWLLSHPLGGTPPARAADRHVCLSGCAYASIQDAVDDASPGDVIKVAAGTYTDLHARPRRDITTTGLVTQIVYISKTVTIQGGYTTTNWSTPSPLTQPTTLDAGGQGRVLYISGDISPTLQGLRITGGNAAGLGGGPLRDRGGGAYIISASVTLSDCEIFGNIARAGGGGHGGGAFFLNSSHTTLRHNTVRNNQATEGGGLYFYNSPYATLSDNILRDNVANHIGGGMKHHGGVLFFLSNDATLVGNTISGNYAANNCAGACFASSDQAVLVGNQVISNSARQGGFKGNGAGLYFYYSEYAALRDNVIRNNRGIGDISNGTILGAGVYVGPGSSLDLRASQVISNAATRGGGVYVDAGSQVVMAGNRLIGNSAVEGGGGLYLDNSLARLDNNVIARNSALLGGGVNMTGTAVLTGWHNTLVGSSGEGLRLNAAGSSAALTNTIFATFTTAVNVQAGVVGLEHSLWFSNGINTLNVTPPDGDSPVYGDPLFLDPAGGDYHITVTVASAARDQGLPGGSDQDIDGDARPGCGSLPDIGADETACRYLPLILKNDGR
jgi:hypothetical protein